MSDLESAVELVVRWLDARGHHDLAYQVAVATDPEPMLTGPELEAVEQAIRRGPT